VTVRIEPAREVSPQAAVAPYGQAVEPAGFLDMLSMVPMMFMMFFMMLMMGLMRDIAREPGKAEEIVVKGIDVGKEVVTGISRAKG
jgi:hypothetical protein